MHPNRRNLDARASAAKAQRMTSRAARWIATGAVLVLLSLSMAMILSLVVVSTADIRDEQSQGVVYAIFFVASLLVTAGLAARRRLTNRSQPSHISADKAAGRP